MTGIYIYNIGADRPSFGYHLLLIGRLIVATP